MNWRRLCLALAVTGCQQAPVRAQLVLYVDVDMPVTSQAGNDISPDALFDSLRVDVLDPSGELIDARVFSIASAGALPLAFGLPANAAAGERITVRLRAFRAAFAKSGKLADGQPVLDPRAEVSVDRLVSLELPAEGVIEKSIRLSGDCLGVPARFEGGAPKSTCLDGDQLSVDASEGVTDGAFAQSASGTWPLAFVTPCGSEAPDGARCIPGGFSILGDPSFLAHNELERDALPLRPVVLAPFFMDETEVTVGALRTLIAAGYSRPLPASRDPLDSIDRNCTWADEALDGLPLNCIHVEVADAICGARGGVTPSEAQWEYAARGRGERSLFVWGDAALECCTSNIAYFPGAGCSPEGPETVGSHLITADCAGDVSRDDVLDLNGSVSELTRDAIADYSDACWGSPTASAILHDHVCLASGGRMSRGGNWFNTIGAASLPIRRSFVELDPGFGFRCVYEAAP